LEFRDGGPEDAEVEVVTEVDPDDNEEAKVGTNDDRVKVIEGLGGLGGRGQCIRFYFSMEKELTARKKSLISCVM
jgi:hypothetical protein